MEDQKPLSAEAGILRPLSSVGLRAAHWPGSPTGVTARVYGTTAVRSASQAAPGESTTTLPTMLRFRQLAFYGPSSRELAPSTKPSVYPRMPELKSVPQGRLTRAPLLDPTALLRLFECSFILTGLFWAPSAKRLVTL